MELTGLAGNIAVFVTGWALKLGAAAATVWAAVAVFKVIWSGGKGREVWQLCVGLAVITIVYAALKDLPGTMALAASLGEQAWVAIRAELAAAGG